MDPGRAAKKKKEARPAIRDLTGELLGRYRVVERIDVGGMAVVYRGQHEDLERSVAIKVLGQPHLEADLDDLARRFKREARTIATLRHPNIVQIFDYGVEDDVHYLVMEFVEGTNLQAAMKLRRIAKRPWQPQELLDLTDQVAGALDYAHGQGVVHRDIKPANILLSTSGLPILTDFGLSAIRKTRTTLISTLGQPFGTPEYIAPEQAMDYSSATGPSDLYSFGCILYELVTGHLPFEADTPLSLALMHISSDPLPPSAHVPDLPPAVEGVILRTLEKEPGDRFQTASELAAALRDAWEKGRFPSPAPSADIDPSSPVIEGEGTTTTGNDDAADPSRDLPDVPRLSMLHRLSDPSAAADPSQPMPDMDFTEAHARLVLKAIEEQEGQVSRGFVRDELETTSYYARQLLDEWTEAGLLIKSTKARKPPTVSARLATLARKRLGLPKGGTS